MHGIMKTGRVGHMCRSKNVCSEAASVHHFGTPVEDVDETVTTQLLVTTGCQSASKLC
jgi:hypothetical protein